MRNTFAAFYKPTQDEFTNLFNSAIIVFDTNALLQVYRYSEEARDDFFSTLKRLSDQLWMPYQVGYEYQRNRPGTVIEQIVAYDEIMGALRNFLNGSDLDKLGKALKKVPTRPFGH